MLMVFFNDQIALTFGEIGNSDLQKKNNVFPQQCFDQEGKQREKARGNYSPDLFRKFDIRSGK